MRIFSKKAVRKNIDHIVSLLKIYIKDVKKEHPWLEWVMIFLDNATSTNKNQYLFGWVLVLILRFCFLVAGHTKSKFAPDLMDQCIRIHHHLESIHYSGT